MNTENIKQLIGKYLDAETSLEEEIMLRDYFKKESLPPELKVYSDIFGFTATEAFISPVDDSIEKNVIHVIEKPSKAKIFSLPNLLKAISVAAAILLMIGIINQFGSAGKIDIIENNSVVADTFENPQDAMSYTKKTMVYVSDKFNSGIEKLAALDKFDQGLSQLSKLRQLEILNKNSN